MKKIIISVVLVVTSGFGVFNVLNTNANETLLSSLAFSNIEAITADELPQGWATGRKMDGEWLRHTASIGGGVSSGEIKVEGGITYIRVSCCVLAHAADACNKTSEHPECVNQIP